MLNAEEPLSQGLDLIHREINEAGARPWSPGVTAAMANPSHGKKVASGLGRPRGHYLDGLLAGLAVAAAVLWLASLILA